MLFPYELPKMKPEMSHDGQARSSTMENLAKAKGFAESVASGCSKASRAIRAGRHGWGMVPMVPWALQTGWFTSKMMVEHGEKWRSKQQIPTDMVMSPARIGGQYGEDGSEAEMVKPELGANHLDRKQ